MNSRLGSAELFSRGFRSPKVGQQRFEVIRWQRFESGRHDGHRRALQGGDILPLNHVLLADRVENLDRGLRFRFQAACKRLAILGAHGPKLVIGFHGLVRVHNCQEHFTGVARRDAGEVRADFAALTVEDVADRASRRVHFLATRRVAHFLC